MFSPDSTPDPRKTWVEDEASPSVEVSVDLDPTHSGQWIPGERYVRPRGALIYTRWTGSQCGREWLVGSRSRAAVQHIGRIDPPLSRGHVRKLVAQRRHAERLEGVGHAG
jgi:hypothetical protein